MNKERVKELRDVVGSILSHPDGQYVVFVREDVIDLLSLLDAHAGPTSGERDAMLQWFDTWTNSEHVSDWSVKRKMDGSDAMKAIRSLILSGPAPRKVVSREWVEKFIPCDCIDAYKDRGLSQPDCPLHSRVEWQAMLKELGIEVAEVAP